ncbi:MAG: hypothetical protein IKU48_04045 [Clostridia bacterium]|nr:hypothetical protein [Clostridia bacterium]
MSLNSKNKTLHKLLLSVLLILITSICCICFASAAVIDDATIPNLVLTPNYNNLKDNKPSSYSSLKSVSFSSDEPIDSIYIIFWDNAVGFTISSVDKSFVVENTFLHSFTTLPEEFADCKELTVTFNEKANISDVSAFKKGQLPDWVQTWNAPHEKADLLLNVTHFSNEHTFFAGIIPYHVANGYRTQVVFFTENTNSTKKHEMLDGLWSVGIKNYPVLSGFSESNTKTSADALKAFAKDKVTEDMLIAFQTENIRRFQPQVIVSHDLNGENGNGQYLLNAETLIKAIEYANDTLMYPESSAKYGVWNTPKLYLHLYTENQITLNLDETLDLFNGKTAFQVSQEGYKANKSQQNTWFTKWLNGNDNKNDSASKIETYSPCLFGLYRTTVGEDIQKNSLFENLISYDEQIRLEQEWLEQERLEQERLEQEEQMRLEEESKRLESLKLESIKEESRAAASEQKHLEEQKIQAQEQAESGKNKGILAIIVFTCSIAVLTVILIKKYK